MPRSRHAASKHKDAAGKGKRAALSLDLQDKNRRQQYMFGMKKQRCGLWRQSDILRTNLAPGLITIRVFMVFSRADDKLPKKKRII